MLVIHVEDNPVSQDFVRKVLQSNHYDLLAFESAAKALKATGLHQADLILIEHNSPGGPDGLVLSKRLRTLHPEIPIIMVSSYAHRNEVIQAFPMGDKDFLIKPFSAGQLLQAIGEALLGQNLEGPVEESAHRLLGCCKSIWRPAR